MPRRSKASLTVVAAPRVVQHVQPRRDCPARVAAEFRRIVASMPAAHFATSDAPLIESLARNTVIANKAFDEVQRRGAVMGGKWGKRSPWLLALTAAERMAAMISTRLRLTPQSRRDPKTVGRALSGWQPSVYGGRVDGQA